MLTSEQIVHIWKVRQRCGQCTSTRWFSHHLRFGHGCQSANRFWLVLREIRRLGSARRGASEPVWVCHQGSAMRFAQRIPWEGGEATSGRTRLLWSDHLAEVDLDSASSRCSYDTSDSDRRRIDTRDRLGVGCGWQAHPVVPAWTSAPGPNPPAWMGGGVLRTSAPHGHRSSASQVGGPAGSLTSVRVQIRVRSGPPQQIPLGPRR